LTQGLYVPQWRLADGVCEIHIHYTLHVTISAKNLDNKAFSLRLTLILANFTEFLDKCFKVRGP
jgi:hypothetical protein